MSHPPWLDPAAEVAAPPRQVRDDREWTRLLLAILEALRVPLWQRLQLAAVSALETAWFDSPAVALHNWVGSKAKLDVVRRYEHARGHSMKWFRSAGHLASGDPTEVFYAAWPDDAAYWRDWLARNVGAAPGVAPFVAEYTEAGALFWRGDPEWIRALIKAGYRGNTSQEPKLSAAVNGHRSIVARCTRLAAG